MRAEEKVSMVVSPCPMHLISFVCLVCHICIINVWWVCYTCDTIQLGGAYHLNWWCVAFSLQLTQNTNQRRCKWVSTIQFRAVKRLSTANIYALNEHFFHRLLICENMIHLGVANTIRVFISFHYFLLMWFCVWQLEFCDKKEVVMLWTVNREHNKSFI